MIRITIHDDDFPTVLKDMQVSINPEDYQQGISFHALIHGKSKLCWAVWKETKELIECWWLHRNRKAAEIYGEEEDNEPAPRKSEGVA